MGSPDSGPFPKVLTLYLELSQYPILAGRIREGMRQELFDRGVITPQYFEAEVRDNAIQSQRREGLSDPFGEEPPDVWSRRQEIIRDHLTDFYFAHNLPHDEFERLVHLVLSDRLPSQDVVLTFHPELAPWDMLFAQGEAYESLPPDERVRVFHDLREIKVVLMKAMLNQHLAGERYILMGPGRWGSINTELGIPVSSAYIFNARALVEIFDATDSPEPSYGTHFFQDLVEARIYPLAIAVDDPATEFHRGFFEDSPNRLVEFLPAASAWEASLRLIDISQAASGAHMELVMDGEADQALAYLSHADASASES